jgi:hypothetical protein
MVHDLDVLVGLLECQHRFIVTIGYDNQIYVILHCTGPFFFPTPPFSFRLRLPLFLFSLHKHMSYKVTVYLYLVIFDLFTLFVLRCKQYKFSATLLGGIEYNLYVPITFQFTYAEVNFIDVFCLV